MEFQTYQFNIVELNKQRISKTQYILSGWKKKKEKKKKGLRSKYNWTLNMICISCEKKHPCKLVFEELREDDSLHSGREEKTPLSHFNPCESDSWNSKATLQPLLVI